MTIKMEFDQIITELSSNEVFCSVTKEEVKYLFDLKHEVPKNDEGEEDDSYVSGEVQFMFNKETDELEEILLFPVYEDGEGGYVNGEFIDPPDCIYSFEDSVREYLHSHMD